MACPKPAATTRPPLHTARNLLDVLRDREADVLRFAHDLKVPPTSNQAERDLRPAKLQDKISGRLPNSERVKERYLIRGVLSTAKKHGQNLMTVLRDALCGHLWHPPLRPWERLSLGVLMGAWSLPEILRS